MLSYKIRKVGNVIIVDLTGKLIIGDATLLLREVVRTSIINDGFRKAILNLKETTYADSSGLNEMISSWTTLRNRGGDLKLLSTSAKLIDNLQMIGFIEIFDIFDSEEKAVASLRQSVL